MKSEIEKIIEHLGRHKEYAKNAICASYPFTIDELRKYDNKLDWECVSTNSNLEWNEALYREFEKKIDVGALGVNKNFPWTEEFIDKNLLDLFYSVTPEGNVEKNGFANNGGLPWTEKLIEKYEEHWHWMWLSMNKNIPFTPELIDKYADRWDYESLQFNDRIRKDAELKYYLNIFYDLDVREYFHQCEFCFKGEEILEEPTYSAQFCTCPNFNWTENFASKLMRRFKSKKTREIIASTIRWERFNHWSIDVLDAFEDYWDYRLLDLKDGLTEYLAFAIKKNSKIEEVMNII